MQCITPPECLDWLEAKKIDAVSDRGFPEVVGNYEVFFAAPDKARLQTILARELVEWIGEFETVLFWISDWPAYKPEEMAIITALRRAHGEDRWLIDAPGHIFTREEKDELIGWVSLMMAFGWDGFLFAAPFRGKMFQTSHEDFIWITSEDLESFTAARQFPRKHERELYRETQV
jgi:hypothetical protein